MLGHLLRRMVTAKCRVDLPDGLLNGSLSSRACENISIPV
jgi:hypothetical protein